MRIPINTKQELYDSMFRCSSRRLDDTSAKTDIVDCFSDIAEYLINRCLITIDNEQYRARAVEFYYLNPQHLDFFASFLYGDIFWITGDKSPYGIIFEFGRNFYGRLMKDTYFGYAVITDLESDTPLKKRLLTSRSLLFYLRTVNIGRLRYKGCRHLPGKYDGSVIRSVNPRTVPLYSISPTPRTMVQP